MVADAEILELVEANRFGPGGGCEDARRRGDKAGGEDNITVVCFEVVDGGQ